jgi:agmatine deiminase
VLLRARGSTLSYLAAGLFSALVLLACFASSSTAQSIAVESKNLPQHLTEEELGRLDEIGINQTATPPPISPIRNCAQWEPVEGVLIRYDGAFFALSYDLITSFSEELIVYVLCEESEEQNAYDDMSAGGVNMANVTFINCTTDSQWTRDYGPLFIFTNGLSGLVDHVYNRPRPDDDVVSWELGTTFGLPVYATDFVTSGGNYMSDGHGIAFSTDLVLEENPTLTYEDISILMNEYLGITQYNVIPDISTEGIHHIDCWAKLLNEETILVKQVWEDHPDYAAIEANVTTLETLTNCYGRPYNIVRVYCGKIRQNTAASYTNSIILNDRIYVPLFEIDEDAAALATYEAAMPGYEVLGFTGSWLADDAIHCRALGIHDQDMLFVDTNPLQDFEVNSGNYHIEAMIDDKSEAGLVPEALLVYWRLQGETEFNIAPMAPAGGTDIYCADIPKQVDETVVEYYVSAEDYSGRISTEPPVAPGALYSFDTGTTQTTDAETPGARLALEQNHPNPFNPSTTIRFNLPEVGFVTLKIYDASGREIATLVDGIRSEGAHSVDWNGRNSLGTPMNSGVYFYELRTAKGLESRKMILIR